MNRVAKLLAPALPALLLAACSQNTTPQVPTETTAAQCQDGQDNDSDAKIDCQDPDCQGFVFCVQARPSEVTAVECSDGADNDGDGKTDCQDADCKGFVFCQSAESSSTACSNDLDDDGDDKVDCDDPDCAGLVFCQPPTENSAALCSDGQDNDGDGEIDCEDPDCAVLIACLPPTEATAPACSDRRDNDGDSKVDCADADCKGFIFCAAPGEDDAASCQDGEDNDSDSLTDCDDPSCQGFSFCAAPTEADPTSCQDGEDNDSDSLIDCEDPGCQAYSFCAAPSETSAPACQDEVDNDSDSLIDCEDPDCQGFSFCATPGETSAAACQDGQDNDSDGLTDCLDPDCQGFTFCFSPDETTAIACQDRQDNDHDGLTDCLDPDCAGYIFCRTDVEVSSTACQDGRDNDADGQTDCADPDCRGYVFCLSEESTTAACQDGQDNDSDGQTDCADPDCAGFVFCVFEESNAAACQDGQDNDSDGQTDCADSDCQGFVFCLSEESSAAACQDGQDNDSDGQIDCADSDCAGFVFCAAEESTAADCQDGADNDGDGQTDCQDPDCSGYTFCLPPAETTLAACQDGQDNDLDGQTDCEDDDCGGFAICQQSGQTETTLAECQDGRDNDNDGATDCADEGCWDWSVCDHYQGFPLHDAWGDAWDGMERAPATQADAEATCAALGGRLPTATELWRNNWTSGTGDLGNNTATNTLWTRIERQTAGQYALVRLFDGNVTYAAGTAKNPYRCIWPDGQGQGFDAFRCHGPAGSPCFDFGRYWSVDAYDRAPLDYAAAANECEFYGASLPHSAEWGELIHGGLPNGTNNWLWSAKSTYWYSGNYGTGIVRWTDANASRWYYDNGNMGAVSGTGEVRNFRCVGLKHPADFAVPNPSTCNGGCASFEHRRSRVVADTQDRVATRMAIASATCRAEGAMLPNLADATDLIHEGWENGSNAWTWVADAMYWYNGGFGHGLVRWSGAGLPSWAYIASTYGSLSGAASNQAYRCVWHQKKPAPPACQASEVVEWNGSQFVCAAGTLGDSNGGANVIQIVDEWGNAWDGIQRNTPTTWAQAKQTCESLGGRLPTGTELWAVRASGNPHDPIGDVNSTSYLWTNTPARTAGYYSTVRISDGASSAAAEGSNQYYRCIWPASRNDVLTGRNCYGPPGDECFVTSDGIVTDTYDRVALDMAAAIEECAAAGGRLPDHRHLIRIIHSGAPNGSNQWLWVADSVYWYSGGYGYAIARWQGDGTPGWEYTANTTAERSWGYDLRRFRCVYAPELR